MQKKKKKKKKKNSSSSACSMHGYTATHARVYKMSMSLKRHWPRRNIVASVRALVSQSPATALSRRFVKRAVHTLRARTSS
eukprot:4102272-Prymnesium_polylepis.1